MRVYLARTGLGDATYIPEKLRGIDLICPSMYKSRVSDAPDYMILLPKASHSIGDMKHEEILKALNQRIQNPDDNTEFSVYSGGGFMSRGIRTKPLPVKEKLLSRSETAKLESIVERITSRKECLRRAVSFNSVFYNLHKYDEEGNFKDLPNIKAKLKLQLKTVICIRDYETFFNKAYESADWVGKSEEALVENA